MVILNLYSSFLLKSVIVHKMHSYKRLQLALHCHLKSLIPPVVLCFNYEAHDAKTYQMIRHGSSTLVPVTIKSQLHTIQPMTITITITSSYSNANYNYNYVLNCRWRRYIYCL